MNSTIESNQLLIQPGIQEFQFRFDLPDTVPSTFVGEFGNITYFIEARIKSIFSINKDIVSRKTFPVCGLLDLGQFPDAAASHVFSESQRLHRCKCARDGSFGFEFKTLKAGYSVGEKMKFVLHLENSTRRKMDRITLKLIQVNMFT